MMELRARQDHDRKLVRMRGPEGDRAREQARTGGSGPRHRGPQPIMTRMRHDSPQVIIMKILFGSFF